MRLHDAEIRELVLGERLVMSTAQGPFPMETTCRHLTRLAVHGVVRGVRPPAHAL